jgi:Fur family transcriptional regulator, ferric uptake regulator
MSRQQAKKALQNPCNNQRDRKKASGNKIQRHGDFALSVTSIRRECAAISSSLSNAAESTLTTSVAIGFPNSIERSLLARGIRLTRQRLAVVKVMEETPQCRNVGVILRRARKFNSAIHRGTVYRTLALLERHGMLAREAGCMGSCPFAGECTQVQMSCLQCGKKVEFASGSFGDVARCVEKDCRFRVASAVLNLSGYCQDCRI